ncbi:hypothetical protein DFH08DRAFT_955862 [Mycena albidolilacea]|uniref:Uncharacterized protein n=1 Tax=Mycena albidolilacea TaxID=1033008 RepID=A0AAD7AD17_9AGAR|nr:hypothetical protein DFH08DRAFT_955862 [Mycena albidolilacea]
MSSSPAPTHLTAIGLRFVERMLPKSAPSPTPRTTAEWSPLTESEARAVILSELHPGIVFPPAARPPMPQSEIDRLSRKIGRENTLQRTLHPIPASIAPEPATSSQPKWSPLTESEARALIHSERYPGTAPPFILSPERRNMPQAEIDRLSRKMGRENTLQRTHCIREPTVVGPVTPDQRILLACRRKSYPAPSEKLELDSTPLW